MNLLEHQAKQLLRDHALPVPDGVEIHHAEQTVDAIRSLDAPFWMLKAQIHAGERANYGGVVRVDNAAAAQPVAQALLGSVLRTPQTRRQGETVNSVLVEAGYPPVRELYLGFLVDPEPAEIAIIGAAIGGSIMRDVDLAERLASNAAQVCRLTAPLHGELDAALCDQLADELDIETETRTQFNRIVRKLHQLFIESDATLLEVNPLAVLADHSLMCLDCKITIDTNALHRQPALVALTDHAYQPGQRGRATAGYNYTALDGDLGCVVTGAGLALATMDMVTDAGLAPANFLDLPPGCSTRTIEQAIELLVSREQPTRILVNAIAGGFTDLTVMADALIAVAALIEQRNVVVRFAGDGCDEAWDRIAATGMEFRRARTMADALVELQSKGNGHAN